MQSKYINQGNNAQQYSFTPGLCQTPLCRVQNSISLQVNELEQSQRELNKVHLKLATLLYQEIQCKVKVKENEREARIEKRHQEEEEKKKERDTQRQNDTAMSLIFVHCIKLALRQPENKTTKERDRMMTGEDKSTEEYNLQLQL